MPAPIPEAIKSKVIELWLLGYSRDSMASANNISTGAVSNIGKKWEDKLGRDVMRGLREIGVLVERGSFFSSMCNRF